MCHIHNIIKDRLFFLDSFLKEQSLPVIKLNENYHDFYVAPFFFLHTSSMLNIKINISDGRTCT